MFKERGEGEVLRLVDVQDFIVEGITLLGHAVIEGEAVHEALVAVLQLEVGPEGGQAGPVTAACRRRNSVHGRLVRGSGR
jgi:hypothetical protein